jgi:TPR repeat protein
MYLSGLGVERNVEEGLRYLEMSASQGEVYSQYNFALLLKGQDDIPAQVERSAYWLKAAAEQDFAAAQIDLAIVYLQGSGVVQDNAEGFKWTLLGEMNGDQRGVEIRRYCEGTLQEDELTDGRERAEHYLKSGN